MRVRAHISMLFHLDKCIGCHTCSIACKNIWTDRPGTEYMWWNNVETKPGTGYPVRWEDQVEYKGGWELKHGELKLKLHNKLQGLANLFYNPALPELDDYYEPFTFDYRHLFNAPEGNDQPVARPVSMVTGEPIDQISSGPNWDDDLGGSEIYAKNDPDLQGLSEEVKAQLSETERLMFFYLPRICNHCLNPACVAACPSGAIHKRAEDGIVLVNQDKCRGWRMCVASCPYKKVYYNWGTGKSEKCILCFPRLETGQAPACAHSCVGRIRYLGVLLYDADKIEESLRVPDDQLVEKHREIILDPCDPAVIAAAKEAGIDEGWIRSAQTSPVYKFVKEWKMALPLHPEFRTMAMMYYIPPLSPVISTLENGMVKLGGAKPGDDLTYFHGIDEARVPIKYLANLMSAGNETPMREIMRKLLVVRMYMRAKTVKGEVSAKVLEAVMAAGLTPKLVEDIYYLTTMPTLEERFVIPPYHREFQIEQMNDPLAHKASVGFGTTQPPKRGA